ncbi:hypothetical protein N7478_005185 [Penicillium angulare]|uniref:uncharacterized protein n=1 Tax=Penicillium angulare TaxID=116970 RepID=UPI0025414B56|nr:uncharacterized protein N7478_005185 [Penicillium angulare]KAJ5279813.1 hypothetical protein N7478_005185 [Penicillium angulare]
MPPRKSTSSVTPADPDDQSLLSPVAPSTSDKPITATEQQIKARAELGVSVEDYLLPRSLTIRLAKAVLPPNTTIQKDAVLAIQKAATVFVSYLSSHANDATLKRTLAPADVFAALSELEFDSFRSRLEQELDAYTEIKAGKRKAKKSDANGGADVAPAAAADEDVEMVDNPSKRVKRDDEGGEVPGGDGDETQDEEIEEEEEHEPEQEQEGEDEEEDDAEETQDRGDEDIDRVEDLDQSARPMDPDADETDDDDGPASQLRDDLGLG